jgi:hypothetical protein
VHAGLQRIPRSIRKQADRVSDIQVGRCSRFREGVQGGAGERRERCRQGFPRNIDVHVRCAVAATSANHLNLVNDGVLVRAVEYTYFVRMMAESADGIA